MSINSPWVIDARGVVHCGFCGQGFAYFLDPRKAHEDNCPWVAEYNTGSIPESIHRAHGRQLLQEQKDT